MEPRQNGPTGGYESAPRERGTPGEQNAMGVEIAAGREYERREIIPNGGGEQTQGALPILPMPIAVPQPVAAPMQSTTAIDDSALLAADEDLIEKEWVDQAKKIISETRDDPHAREAAVQKLQAEYIRKRYGRIVGGAK